LALPTALVVGLAAVALVRALGPAHAVSRLAAASVAPKVASSLSAQVDFWKKSAAELAVEPTLSQDQNVEEPSAETTSASERHEERSAVERVAAPRAAVVSAPVAPPVVPVKLPELPPPAVINMSDSASSRVGTLNVLSSPPSSVVLDGRPIGQSPRIVQVPAGTHTVVFIHPLYGRQSRRVIVNPGRTVAASADF
jgi:serine/threonine-protein kinase